MLPAYDTADQALPPIVQPAEEAPVVGGVPASMGSWDDTAALYTVGDQFACSGVLIAPSVVLTAGHCGYGIEAVVVGTTDHTVGGERVRVRQSVIHPDPFTTFDAALLLLDKPVQSVVPRPLAIDCLSAPLVVGADVAIVGYGATDAWASDWDSTLREAWTTVRDATCADLYAGCNEAVAPGGELVAGGDGVDSCSGDSGGPLFLATDDGPILVGITSRAALPAQTPCGGGGIYVRVDALVPWIEEATGATLPRPECGGYNWPPTVNADPITVHRGMSGRTIIGVQDPDEDQKHTFTLVVPPKQGMAFLDPDGALIYLANDTFVGEEVATVAVTDDGVPAQSREVTVSILVNGGAVRVRGCQTVPGPVGTLWWALWVPIWARCRRK